MLAQYIDMSNESPCLVWSIDLVSGRKRDQSAYNVARDMEG